MSDGFRLLEVFPSVRSSVKLFGGIFRKESRKSQYNGQAESPENGTPSRASQQVDSALAHARRSTRPAGAVFDEICPTGLANERKAHEY
jgi:hypothetical protein